MTKPSAREIEEFIHGSFPSGDTERRFEVEEASEERVRVRFFARPSQLRPGGTVSGPVQMAAADLVAWAVILRALGLSAAPSVTSSFNISFLSRPSPADLQLEGELLKLGKRQAVCAVRVLSNGALVAHATVTYALAHVTVAPGHA